MRFLPAEYDAIIAAIDSKGFEGADFSFVKKRGKLHISFSKSPLTFFFFRSTETILNSERKWEEKLEYKFGKGKEELFCDEWKDVLKYFEKWLDEIKP